MARIGQFIGPTEAYSAPLNVIHPPDNNIAKSSYHPSLLDPKLKLDEKRQRELQEEILALMAVLKMARDLPGQ